jgi:predicted hotdog family 3-hydroxylacyl-ACP dehydratase
MFADRETYIPHRDRMRLVEELLEADDAHAVTAATVGPDWPIGEDGLLNPLIFIDSLHRPRRREPPGRTAQ